MNAIRGSGVAKRVLNGRTRVLLDRSLTPATILDCACEHWKSGLLYADSRPAFPGFDGETVSPGDALSFVGRVASILHENSLPRQARVAIFKENSVDYVLLSLAVIRAGGVAVPINPGMPIDRLAPLLDRADCDVVICDSRTFGRCIRSEEKLPMVRQWIFCDAPEHRVTATAVLSEDLPVVSGDAAPASLTPESPVILAHTSGTTGSPKQVVVSARGFIQGIRAHFLTEPPLPWRRVVVAGPFSHLALQVGITTTMLADLRTWTISRADPEQILGLIERRRIEIAVAFPFLYLRMYEAGLHRFDLDSIRAWVSVADAVPEVRMRAFCENGSLLRVFGRRPFGSIFVEPFGSSEIGGPAIRRIRFRSSSLRFTRRFGRPLLFGPAVKIVNDFGSDVPVGEVGNMMIKGRTMFSGYLKPNDRDAGRSGGGWWLSGDEAYRDRLGRVHHVDRSADVVHTAEGPFFTLPAEDQLHAYPGVLEAVVIGVRGFGGCQVPVAVLRLESAADFDPHHFIFWANKRLSGPVGIRDVHVVRDDEIPRGLTGKILKRDLRAKFESEYSKPVRPPSAPNAELTKGGRNR